MFVFSDIFDHKTELGMTSYTYPNKRQTHFMPVLAARMWIVVLKPNRHTFPLAALEIFDKQML